MSEDRALARRLAAVQDHSTLELTTIGRVSGKQRTVTVWFLVEDDRLYLVTLKMRRHWPRNLLKNGYVELRIGGTAFTGHATQIKDARRFQHVRELLARKYWAAWLGAWVGLAPEGAFAVNLEH